jgi:enamine deaminase RidA (YjgF/YER057c/UK114 family)
MRRTLHVARTSVLPTSSHGASCGAKMLATRAPAPAEKKPRAKRTSASLPKQAAGHHQVVSTALAPAAIGPYSQAVVATGPFLFVSGCIGLHPQVRPRHCQN